MDNTIYLIPNGEKANSNNFDYIYCENEKVQLLSVKGIRFAEKLCSMPELKKVDAIYSINSFLNLETIRYIAFQKSLPIKIDDRLKFNKLSYSQNHIFNKFNDSKLKEIKKSISDAFKNVLMFENGNHVVISMDILSIAILLSNWCTQDKNCNDELILTYNDKPILDDSVKNNFIFKLIFDGLKILSIEKIMIDV